ncbi:MAG: hypothetical protein A2171_01465 [Candidatus Levybacteria bacterium RBG_13_35_9]|nr:MAG: hypothetical protein A2171_01465 [Candidatus Levybacteria bacterium RBG_13_35_9]
MAVDAADMEQKWQASDFSARMPGGAKGSDKVYDSYSPENNSKVAEKLNQKPGQFKAAPRRGLLSIIAGKLGF